MVFSEAGAREFHISGDLLVVMQFWRGWVAAVCPARALRTMAVRPTCTLASLAEGPGGQAAGSLSPHRCQARQLCLLALVLALPSQSLSSLCSCSGEQPHMEHEAHPTQEQAAH